MLVSKSWQRLSPGLICADPEATSLKPVRPCEGCGQPIDPIHRCERCRDHYWCGRHNSPYKQKDARYCSQSCRKRAGDQKRREAAAGGSS